MRFQILTLTLLTLIVGACATQPTPSITPTAIAVPSTPTLPPPTPTELPTLAPLPTEIALSIPQSSGGGASIQFVHGIAELSTLNVSLDAQPVAFGLRYRRVSPQAEISEGDYILTVTPADVGAGAQPILTTDFSIRNGQNIIITLTPGIDETSITIIPHTVDQTPLPEQNASVALVHAIPNAAEATIVTGNLLQNTENDEENTAPLPLPMIGFSQSTLPVMLPEGEVTLPLAGPIESHNTTLQSGQAKVLVLMGSAQAPFITEVVQAVPTRAETAFVNLSRAVSPVDVYLDGELAVEAVFFERDTRIRAAVSGTRTIDIYPENADTSSIEPLLTEQVTLMPSGINYIMLTGPAFDLRLTHHADPLEPQAEADNVSITIMNTIHEQPTLIETRSTEGEISFRYAQPINRTYPAGFIDLNFLTPANEEVVEYIPNFDFDDSRSYLVPVTGRTMAGEAPYILSEALPVTVTSVDDEQQPTPISFLNAMTIPLQVVIDGATTDGEIRPSQVSTPIELQPGTYQISLINSATLESLSTSSLFVNRDSPQRIVVFEQNEMLEIIPLDSQIAADPGFPAAQLRFINLSGETTIPLNFTVMSAVEPERRLSTIIDSRTDVITLPVQIPRNQAAEPISSGNATAYFPFPEETYDLHIYNEAADRLLASIYNQPLEAGQTYELIVFPSRTDTIFTPLEAALIQVRGDTASE